MTDSTKTVAWRPRAADEGEVDERVRTTVEAWQQRRDRYHRPWQTQQNSTGKINK